MPTIQRTDSLATVTTLANALSGTQFEFLPYNANIAMGFTCTATGTLVSVYAGSDLVVFELVPVVKATSPVNPDDFTVNFDAYEGTRLVITMRNPTAGTLVIMSTTIITPL
jgi:hypothetical protein